jgi:hypothetical protein
MNATTEATIAIRGMGARNQYAVCIDERQVGALKGKTGFDVEPGAHTVVVSRAWMRSRPFHVTLEPNSRTELIMHEVPGRRPFLQRWWFYLLVGLSMGVLDSVIGQSFLRDDRWYWTILRVAVIYAGGMMFATAACTIVSVLFFRQYWVLWELRQVND